MFEQMLKLTTLDDVYKFVSEMSSIDCDIDLMTEHRRHIVDAKSILGVLSLDLSKPIILKAYSNDIDIINQLKAAFHEIDNISYQPSSA